MTPAEVIAISQVTRYYVDHFNVKYDVDAIKFKINQIKDELQNESATIQNYVVNHLVSNFLSLSVDKNEVRHYARQLGLLVVIEQQSEPTKSVFEAHKVDYDDSQVDDLLSRMKLVDWSYTEQYADRLTKADKDNILLRSKLSNELSTLTVETLRKCWVKCVNQTHKNVIFKYGIRE